MLRHSSGSPRQHGVLEMSVTNAGWYVRMYEALSVHPTPHQH